MDALRGLPEPEADYESFARRILEEPEYREMVIAVLRNSSHKVKPRVFAEELLTKLVGPPLQAKAIVTLFRILQGAEYPEFCQDLFETSKMLTEQGAVEEGVLLFISVGLICFGGHGLSERERKEAIAFLRAGQSVVKFSNAAQKAFDDYANRVIEPQIDVYRMMRRNLLEKVRNVDAQPRNRLALPLVLMLAAANLLAIMHVLRRDREDIIDEEGDRTSQPIKSQKPHANSLSRTICGSPVQPRTIGFKNGYRTVRIVCDSDADGPSIEIAERGPNGVTNCIDVDLDDTPDACGSTETPEEEIRVFSPPRQDLDRWFRQALQKAVTTKHE